MTTRRFERSWRTAQQESYEVEARWVMLTGRVPKGVTINIERGGKEFAVVAGRVYDFGRLERVVLEQGTVQTIAAPTVHWGIGDPPDAEVERSAPPRPYLQLLGTGQATAAVGATEDLVTFEQMAELTAGVGKSVDYREFVVYVRSLTNHTCRGLVRDDGLAPPITLRRTGNAQDHVIEIPFPAARLTVAFANTDAAPNTAEAHLYGWR